MQLVKINKVLQCPDNLKERWIRRFNWQQKRAFMVANCYLSPPLLIDYLWFGKLHTDLEFIGIITILFILTLPIFLLCV